MIRRVIVLAVLCAAVPSAAWAQSGSQYLVLFKSTGVPATFNADVGALGGSIVFSHPVGIAVVRDLSARAAEKVAARRDVAHVEQDTSFQLDPIVAADAIEDVRRADLASPTDPTTATRYSRQWNM